MERNNLSKKEVTHEKTQNKKSASLHRFFNKNLARNEKKTIAQEFHIEITCQYLNYIHGLSICMK